MSKSHRKKLLAATLILASGTVLQLAPQGCGNYLLGWGLTSLDFCSILNCEGGTFFDFCNPVPILADCPDQVTQ
jgi:hypothetical protein